MSSMTYPGAHLGGQSCQGCARFSVLTYPLPVLWIRLVIELTLPNDYLATATIIIIIIISYYKSICLTY